jgi:methylthioxylose transferase
LIYAIALGAASYASVFYEPTPSVMGLLFVFLTGYALWRGEIDFRTVAALTGAVVLAFFATYGLFLLLFRFDLLTTLRSVAADAVKFNVRVRRPYYPWVAQNLLDLAFGAGLCQAVLFCAATALAVSGKTLTAGETAGRLAALCVGIAIALVATDLAGINRGEVVRLWIFLACFLQIPAAYICRRLDSRLALMLVLGTTLLQTALSASMLAFLQP